MKQCVPVLLFGALSALCPARVDAQTTVTDIVGFLVTNQAVRTGDIDRDRAAAEATRDTITRALLINLTSVPLATSSSGFLYRLNPELGTVERATNSFGGFFVERALTPGHGRGSFGMSASSSNFERLDDHDLRDGTFLTFGNRFSDEAAPFETEMLTLRVRTSTLTAFASVGVTDRLEIGGAIPFVRLTIEGQRMTLYRGETFLQASGSANASGVADAAVRAKYTLASGRSGGVAIAGELRLPTGDADNLLGAGSAAFRILAIGALESGPLMLSANAGIVRRGISDELNAGAVAAVAVHPRLSLTAELLARNIAELRPIELSSQPHPTIGGVQTIRVVGGEPGRLIAGGVAGFKWNPAATIVIGANVRWNLTTAGLNAPVTPSVAFEYGF
jgi:Putative MetA-pathway of phenol degradation